MPKYTEISDKIEQYSKLVIKWNNVHNLISKNSVDYIKERHIDDSLRVLSLIDPDLETICDFGSGAGFPGILIGIFLNNKNSGCKLFLFESRKKKADFLNLCIDELGLINCKVINDRIENVKNIKADLITARAFSSLKNIFNYAKNYQNGNTEFLLHKGEKVTEEIVEAEKNFSFDYKFLDKNSDNGVILLASNVK